VREPFHRGEIDVQTRAGVRERASRVGRIVTDRVGDDEAWFLERRTFAVLASVDAEGRPWASPMSGEPGIVRVEDSATVTLVGMIPDGDPFHENLRRPGPVAVLGIDLSTRSRFRVNGLGRPLGSGGYRVEVREAFGNCQKYVQVRHLTSVARPAPKRVSDAAGLEGPQRRSVEAADTFFIASHAEGGADVSHRGGRPGFVRVEPAGTIVVPDYSGNNMFQTLGNIALVPKAGLLVLDFESGRALELTGDARIDWDEAHVRTHAGARRLLRVHPTRVLEWTGALAVHGGLAEASPFNP
jgi:predicted pyridoxine 5'-phosphate oxidase superfamily flavin-nucleotide-binding protein